MKSRQQRGFTVIEMLVVISIIAILSVLLFAALRSARASARLAQCGANLKNLGAGTVNFSNRNKGYGMPGPPNAHCRGDLGLARANQHGMSNSAEGHFAPNTLWSAVPLPPSNSDPFAAGQGIIRPPRPLPPQSNPTRFINHGLLFKFQDVNDERAYSCPDIANRFTGLDDDLNGYERTIRPVRQNADPPGVVPGGWGGTGVWMSSYDYRSCYDPSIGNYNPYIDPSNKGVVHGNSQGDLRPDLYVGSYYLINFGRQSAETAMLADTIQNPPPFDKITHDNTRLNVVFADGHLAVLIDDNRASRFAASISVPGRTALPAYPSGAIVPGFGSSPTTIFSMGLAISRPGSTFTAGNHGYWSWNERVWAELLSEPDPS